MSESLTSLINGTLKTLMANKEYDAVIEKCNVALDQYPKSATLYIERSTAYQRKGAYGKAYKDAELAIVAAYQAGKREKIGEAQLRRAIVLTNLKRYDDALYSLDKAVEYSGKESSTMNIWKNKINMEKGSDGFDPDLVTIEDIPKSIKFPEPVEPTKPQKIQEITDEQAKAINNQQNTSTSTSLPKSTSNAPETPIGPNVDNIRHDFYQSSDKIDLSLFIKNAPKDKVKVEFTETSASVSFPLLTGSEFVYDFDPFYGKIDPKASTFKVFGTKIELNLVKQSEGKWEKLLGADATHGDDQVNKLTNEMAKEGLGLTYPTSSKSGPKNWDKITSSEVKNIEDQERDNDPNAFFRVLYENSDPETQRAMIKSYTESNGTALSTNWSEVSKKKTEVSPPDGMEAKYWKDFDKTTQK